MHTSIATCRTNDLPTHALTALIDQQPKISLINEIGVIFHQDHCPLAESFLLEKLHDPDPRVRYVAYCHLSLGRDNAAPATLHTLELFRHSRFNLDVVEDAKRILWI